MKKAGIIILFISVLLTGKANSQETNPVNSYKNLALKVSYFGEFVLHPGFTAGIDYTVRQNKWFNFHWDSELGAYFHKWNNNALFIQSALGTRFTSKFSVFIDVRAGIGYMITTPNGHVYVVDNDGKLSSKGRPFNSHFKPNAALLFGWDGSRKRKIPVLIEFGVEAYWQSHFNHSMLPHAAFRLGVIYRLKK